MCKRVLDDAGVTYDAGTPPMNVRRPHGRGWRKHPRERGRARHRGARTLPFERSARLRAQTASFCAR
eukprot:3836929-Prymnesium_polylepis.1